MLLHGMALHHGSHRLAAPLSRSPQAVKPGSAGRMLTGSSSHPLSPDGGQVQDRHRSHRAPARPAEDHTTRPGAAQSPPAAWSQALARAGQVTSGNPTTRCDPSPFLRLCQAPNPARYDGGRGVVLGLMTEPSPTSLGSLVSAALPSTIAAGLFAIGALLVNIQIQQAATQAAVQQLVKSVEELKNDSKQRLDDLERRVRTLEIQK